MNREQTIQTAGRFGGYCARHFLALGFTVTMVCTVWTITYFALLLWAILIGSGPGGPLAYPAGLLFFFVAGVAISLILLFPSTALAEWFARRCGFSVLTQIPISVANLALLCAVVIGVTPWAFATFTQTRTIVGIGVLFFANLFPLGVYWWTAQSVPLVVSLFHRFCSGKLWPTRT